MKLKIAQVVGLNTDQKAAQVTSSIRDENSFLAILELNCDDAFTKGRQILSELEDFYFEFEGTPVDKLNATFEEAGKKLEDESEFELGLAAISGKILYLIVKGKIEVYLKRGNKLTSLVSVGVASELISGFLQPGDRLLLSTKNLTSFLGSDLEKSLSLPIETFEEEVEGRIGASDLEEEEPTDTTTLPLEKQALAALAVEVEEEKVEISSLEPQVEEKKEVQQDYSNYRPEDEVFKTGAVKNVVGKLVGGLGKVKSYFPSSGRGRLVVAIILIIIIFGGLGYKYKLSSDQEKQAQFNQLMQEAKDDFNAAKGLASLAPGDAKTKLDSATDKVNKALALKSNDSEAQDLKKQIEQDSSSILQQSNISDFPVFLDMDLVKKNFRATQMSLNSGKLLLLDPTVKTLVSVNVEKKSNQILAGSEQLGDAAYSSINGNLAFVYSKDKGVLRVDTSTQKITTIAKKDSDWGEIKDIYGFAGNIYVLDGGNPSAGSGQIWKYLPTADGYSDKRTYLNSGVKADLSNALRMQIESSVYILKSGGEMLRFTRGDKDNFSYGGLDKGIKDPKSFFVSSDTDNLYVLDSGNSRLVILTKTGAYKGQIGGSKFATATDLVVDEQDKKVYLLDGSKIYSVDLK